MEDTSARVHGWKKRTRADDTCLAKRAGMANDASEGSKLIAQPWSDARWSARMRYERTALSALPEGISRPRRLGRALRLRHGNYPRGCPLEWPEVIDGVFANHKRGWWLLSCTDAPPVPFRRVSPSFLAVPSLACFVVSLNLCPGGYLPDQQAPFAEYRRCRLPETRQGASLRPRGCILGSVPLERGTGRTLVLALT